MVSRSRNTPCCETSLVRGAWHFEAMQKKGDKVAGQKISSDLVAVNGLCVTVEDSSWGLCGRPPTSRSWSRESTSRRRISVAHLFDAVDSVLRAHDASR
jgi:phosphomannomutase/phosphoglucomutase